jgi:predicted O-methyltransferase YrrM
LKYSKKGDLESAEILKWLIKLTNSKKTIDIGVFTGYSSLIMAQSIPQDGKVYAIERKKDFVEIGM